MSIPVLVATPHIAFGELLRISLEDSSQYRVRLVQSAKEVRDAASHDTVHLAILDAALADEPFVPLCMNLLEQQPGIRLVIIPPDNNPNHPALGGLMPHGYLTRPFYLPELIDLVSRLTADREKQFQPKPPASSEPAPIVRSPSTLPAWLQDSKSLNKSLEKELPATQAVAAVVGLNRTPSDAASAKGAVQACAGVLSESAAQELLDIVFRYWNAAEKTDLMRFIRLSTDKKDFLVYATRLTGDLVLALVYETFASLAQVRPRTRALAQLLTTQPVQPGAEDQKSSPAVQPDEQPAGSAPASSAAEGSSPAALAEPAPGLPASHEPATQPLEDNQFAGPLRVSEEGAEDGEAVEGRLINLSALLGAVPPPNPGGDSRPASLADSGWMTERQAGSPIPTLPGGLNDSSAAVESEERQLQTEEYQPRAEAHQPGAEEQRPQTEEQRPKKRVPRPAPFEPQTMSRDLLPDTPALPVDYSLPAGPEIKNRPMRGSGRSASLEVKTEPPVMPPGISMPIEPRSTDAAANLALEPETQIKPIEDTHPNVVSTISNLDQLEPASPALSLLNYTCVLIPRLPQHYLTGELADRMAIWVQQLCLAFGWRLEGISIRPEYLQWTVQVAPAISPGNLVRIVRQRTSLNVFNNYPHLADENPSGDFWATGYLIVSGVQPPSAQLLREYIAQTRKRQGVNK